MTGGALIVAVTLFQWKWPDLWKWRGARRFLVLLIFLSVFQSWEQEYVSRTGRERDLKSAHSERDYALAEKSLAQQSNTSCQAALNGSVQNASKALNQSQQILSQTQQAQSKVQDCLLELGKAQQGEPEKITAWRLSLLPARPRTPGQFSASWIILTNKVVTPIRVLMTCDAPIIDLDQTVLGTGGTTSGGWGGNFSDNEFGIGITSPAWTPQNPLLITISTSQQQISCRFRKI